MNDIRPRNALLLLLAALPAIAIRAEPAYERAPIDYERSEAVDLVAEYFADEANLSDWRRSGPSGYLRSFLQAFGIPTESQVLVFTKTSLQASRIDPGNPRAIYFNDELYVGWVPGSDLLEISVPSPQTGTNFYTLSDVSGKPKIVRETQDCLRCHGGSFTGDVPGHLIRSVFPEATGFPIYKAGTQVVDQSTPVEERWGGWLVTGSEIEHRGNQLFKETDRGADFDRRYTIEDVPDRGYIERTSDLIALMVLEHQAQLHTQLADLTIQTRRAFYDQKAMDELLNRTEPISDSTRRRIKSAADKALRIMLFSNEASIQKLDTSKSPFARSFGRRGSRDARGRSLYDLKMDGRMFRYPLSFLIYSDTVASLPEAAQDYLWTELERILRSPEGERGYQHLSQADKRAILEILQATHPRFKS